MNRLLTLVCALLAAGAGSAAAQGGATLTVEVADSATGAPLPGATVTLGTGASATTNPRGLAEFRRLPPGPVAVRVSRLGYEAREASATVSDSGAARLSVALPISPVVLARLRVSADALPRSYQLRDFYVRKATWGSGYFLGRREIERQRSAPFSQLLRGVPNVRFITDPDNQQTYVRFGRAYTIGECPPTFYLDGQLYPVDPMADIDREFSPEEIEGIEVYSGARVPPQFNGGRAQCGVIVIWTRER